MEDLLLSEYNSIRSEIIETHKAPERWGSILVAFAGVILGFSITKETGFVEQYFIVFSSIPMLILIMIIYSSIRTIQRLSIIQIRIADKLMKNDHKGCLSDEEDKKLLNSCACIYEKNLQILSWLILFYILSVFFILVLNTAKNQDSTTLSIPVFLFFIIIMYMMYNYFFEQA